MYYSAEKKMIYSFMGLLTKKGNISIEPQFLNVLNFQGNKTLALIVHKETIGFNDIFKKMLLTTIILRWSSMRTEIL